MTKLLNLRQELYFNQQQEHVKMSDLLQFPILNDPTLG